MWLQAVEPPVRRGEGRKENEIIKWTVCGSSNTDQLTSPRAAARDGTQGLGPCAVEEPAVVYLDSDQVTIRPACPNKRYGL